MRDGSFSGSALDSERQTRAAFDGLSRGLRRATEEDIEINAVRRFFIAAPNGLLYRVQVTNAPEITVTAPDGTVTTIGGGGADTDTEADIAGLVADLASKAALVGGNSFTGAQALAGELRINSGAGANFARVREFGTVDGTNYGYAETAMGLTNPLAPIPDVFLYSFGSEGRYSAGGVVTARDFYIYDVVASILAGVNVYRLYTDETGVVKLGGSDARTAPGLTILTNGNVTAAGALAASNLSGTNTGDQSFTALTKTAGYTESATTGELIAFCNRAGGFNIILPAAAGNSAKLTYKNLNAAGPITIVAAGTDTIDGNASIVLSAQFASVTLVPDGVGAWGII